MGNVKCYCSQWSCSIVVWSYERKAENLFVFHSRHSAVVKTCWSRRFRRLWASQRVSLGDDWFCAALQSQVTTAKKKLRHFWKCVFVARYSVVALRVSTRNFKDTLKRLLEPLPMVKEVKKKNFFLKKPNWREIKSFEVHLYPRLFSLCFLDFFNFPKKKFFCVAHPCDAARPDACVCATPPVGAVEPRGRRHAGAALARLLRVVQSVQRVGLRVAERQRALVWRLRTESVQRRVCAPTARLRRIQRTARMERWKKKIEKKILFVTIRNNIITFVCVGIGHSQGGIAFVHLASVYWSGLDVARLRKADQTSTNTTL